MALTNEQLDAINLDGENIIVSAGAGSGKTMVLTKRVIRKLESGVSIQQLLILTFTKLAANEMKNRIREAIKEKPELQKELKKLDSSYITTFDSFSLSLVKKYHYLLNVKKNVNIIDSNLLNIKIKEYLDDILEEEYLERKEDFTKLINDFCSKDDKNIRKIILSLNSELDLKYDKEEYLTNYVNNYYNDSYIKNNVSKYLDYLKSIINEIDNDLTEISNLDNDYYGNLVDVVMPIINSDSYENIVKSVNNVSKLPSVPRGSSDELKKTKENLNNNIKSLKELTKISDTSKLINSIKETKPYIEAIIRIIRKLDQRINEYKYLNDLYDFADICKMAIKLVKKYPNICEEVKNSFNEIMVDEYQDTSDLQEEFINQISNNNVYVVGDVKQSIYRFRNANPDLFREKYNLYAKGINGKKIDLLKNFRSRPEVLNNINLIFNLVMSELIGGANYTRDHQMVAGNVDYLNLGNSPSNDIDIYCYDYDKEQDFNKEEIESFIIANDINKKIREHYQVFDRKLGKLRDVTYSDFAVLIDRSSSFSTFKKIFLYKQIPLSIYKDEYLNDSSLFMVIRNIFKLINLVYDKKQGKELEYTFLSIGRSFLSNYTDDELFSIINGNSYQKTDIYKRIDKIIDNISSKSIRAILDEIIQEFDIYDNLRKIPDILNNYINIEYLYTLADNLNKMGYTFKDFNSYLEELKEDNSDIRFSISKEDGESVKIMTIHASKGLEYPICYFPGLYKAFNDQDIKSSVIFNNNLGIITSSEEANNTFYHELFKNNYYQDEISEKIRLFYVALTRVREKIVLVIPNEEVDDNYDIEVPNNIKMKYRSFLDIINSIKTKLTSYIKNVNITDLNLTKDYSLINSKNLFDNSNKLDKRINVIDIPKVITNEKEENHFSKSSSRLFSIDEKKKMDFGTKMHYYLETLDLINPNLLDIESPYKEKIMAFINSDLLKDLSKAKIYQEYEFIENSDNEEKHGIIDLMIDYGDYIDIIDYKLKNIDDEAYIKQLSGYKNHIEKISNKKVNIYLYSIIDENYREIIL